MKSITIKGSQRKVLGKVATKTIRKAGKVPCVLYGGKESIHFSTEEKMFSKLVYTPDVHTVAIELEDGNSYHAILQDIQFHPVSDKILHVDFFELHNDKEIIMEIPVRLIGVSVGVTRGGILRRNNRSLRVKALPENLPNFIEADITNMKIGDKMYVTDLTTKDYIFMHPDNALVCQVRTSRVIVDSSEEEVGEEKEEEASEEENKSV